MIELKDALKQIDNGEPFSMLFCTADQRRNSGGELIDVQKCFKLGTNKLTKQFRKSLPKSTVSKNPNHIPNDTFHICFMPSREVRKVNINLFLELNGQVIL